MKRISLFALSIILITSFTVDANCKTLKKATSEKSSKPAFTISTSAFNEGKDIPKVYTCKGEDYSPPIQWKNPPEGTKSYALIMEDPDAPFGTFVHWVVYNIPPDQTSFSENASGGNLPAGTLEGKNNFSKIRYSGPCPPPGPAHRYFFKLYALDTMLNLSAGEKKDMLTRNMKGHILGQTEFYGVFAR